MNWQSERSGQIEIERDHRHEFRLPLLALVAAIAAVGMIVLRFLYLGLPS